MKAPKKYYIPFLLLVLSILVLLQSPFAPYGNNMPGTDAAVYLYGAREILNGKLLYKDVFDHKGPVIYLIDLIGLLLSSKNFLGVWLMEVLSLFTAAIFLYRTARLFFDEAISFLSVVFLLNTLMPVLELGNLTEEYSLCFAAIALFIYMRVLLKDFVFSFTDLCVLACCFVATIFLRFNLGAMWLGFALMAVITLIRQKRYKEVLKYATLGIVCMVVAGAPFIIYFLATNTLADAIYANFTFNRLYTQVKITPSGLPNRADTISILNKTHADMLMLAYAVIAGYNATTRTNKLVYASTISILFFTITIGCGLRPYVLPHYTMVIIPVLIIPIGSLLQKLKERIGDYYVFAAVVLVIGLSWQAYSVQKKYIGWATKENTENEQIIQYIKLNTAVDDKISVIGNRSVYYLLSGRSSCSRFHYQSSLIKADTTIAGKYFTDLQNNKPKLVLYEKRMHGALPPVIDSFINTGYALQSEPVFSKLDVYKLK